MDNHGTTLLGNRPMDVPHIGLNEVGVRAADLAAEIARAVAESDGTKSRREIFDQFADRASRAFLYVCIARAVDATGVKLAPTKLPPRSMQAPMSDTAQEAELHAAAATVEEIEALSAGEVMPPPRTCTDRPPTPPPDQPAAPTQQPRQAVAQGRHGADLMVGSDGRVGVDVAAGLERALGKCESLMQMAETEEGKIRNPRLLVVAIDLYGKTAERKARVDADLSEASTMQRYLRALTAAALEEAPEIRSRILQRWRGINQQFGL